jgi:pentatricopeptide repeat protein
MKTFWALRYEITCGLILVVLWCLGKIANGRQKTSAKKAAKNMFDRTHLPTSSPKRGGAKELSKDLSSMPAEKVGKITDIDPKLLCDPSWLVPQVMNMSRMQVQKALGLYHAAMAAGLKLQSVPESDCQQMFTVLVTAAIRTSNVDEATQLLQDLQRKGHGVSSELFSSVMKLCASKLFFNECLTIFDLMASDPCFRLADKSAWSCLLFCALESNAYDRCGFFFDNIKKHGQPSYKDYGNMIRFASQQCDWEHAVKLIEEMRQADIKIDALLCNIVLATCLNAERIDEARALLENMEINEGVVDVVAYNTLMKGYAKAGRMDRCVEVFDHLKSRGITASEVTYGILLDGFVNENEMERAAEVFNTMVSEGGTVNTILFTTMIKGFTRAGNVDNAMKVYEQMLGHRSLTPDLITFSLLIKANCDADRLEQALMLLKTMVDKKLRPDEVIFNNLLAGCARHGNDALGDRLYQDMLSSGIRPSNATFSILIRFYSQCKRLEDAVEMLKNEPAKHRVDPEPRLFLQLAQSCIRERQGRRAVEVYEMLAKHSVPTAAVHSSLITTCIKLNMFETAAEVLRIASTRQFRVDGRDANALLDTVTRKRKSQLAQDISASMTKLGLDVKQEQSSCSK